MTGPLIDLADDPLAMLEAYVVRNSPSARSRAHFVNSVLSLIGNAQAERAVCVRAVRAAQALEDTLGNWTELRSSDPLVTALRETLAPFAAAAAPPQVAAEDDYFGYWLGGAAAPPENKQ